MASFLSASQRGDLAGAVTRVISNRPEAQGLDIAARAGVQTAVVDHRQFDSRESFDTALAETVGADDPDVVVLAGFMRILTPIFIDQFSGKLMNIHPSLLPKYQGLNTHQRAIDAKDDVHGVSVHFVTEELDGGPVVLQAKVPILADDTADTLAKRIHEQEHVIYPLVVKWFSEHRLTMEADYAVFDNQPLPAQGAAYPE